MKEKKTVAQKVAELTPEQQDKMLKVGLFMLIAEFVIFVLSILAVFLVVNRLPLDTREQGFDIWLAVTIISLIAVVIIAYVKCPYYGDLKWWYISVHQKDKGPFVIAITITVMLVAIVAVFAIQLGMMLGSSF